MCERHASVRRFRLSGRMLMLILPLPWIPQQSVGISPATLDQSNGSDPIHPPSAPQPPQIIPSLTACGCCCTITQFWRLTCREISRTDEQSGWIMWLMAGDTLFCFGCLKGMASWSGAVLKSDLLWRRLRAGNACYH